MTHKTVHPDDLVVLKEVDGAYQWAHQRNGIPAVAARQVLETYNMVVQMAANINEAVDEIQATLDEILGGLPDELWDAELWVCASCRQRQAEKRQTLLSSNVKTGA